MVGLGGFFCFQTLPVDLNVLALYRFECGKA
jgi:hypothetical protein